jgi:hypothetical protein
MNTDDNLGSPNGASFAYFLLQHKAQLGYKTITKVTVIRAETDEDNDFVDPYLVFHVADAAEPPPDEGSGSADVKRRDSSHSVEVVQQGEKSLLREHKFGVLR